MEIKFSPLVKRIMWKSFVGHLSFFILLSVITLVFVSSNIIKNSILILIAILIIISLWFKFENTKNTSYLISSSKINKKTNFISIDQLDLPSKNVTNISYLKTFLFDRLFNTGTLLIYTSGSSSVDVVMNAVENIEDKYNKISKLIGLSDSNPLSASGEIEGEKTAEFVRRVKPYKKAIILEIIFSGIVFFPILVLITSFAGTGLSFLLANFINTGVAAAISYLSILIVGVIVFIVYTKVTLRRFDRMYYDFYTDKLEYYDGFLTLQKASIPLERITNVGTNETLIDKILGVTSINIETAGSSSSEITVKSVREGKEIVKELKEVLKKHGRD